MGGRARRAPAAGETPALRKSAAELSKKLRKYRNAIRDDAAVWVSWPKKSAKVPTADGIRGHQSLKLVIRREERAR